MIRRLSHLDAFCVRPVLSIETVLSATQEAFKTVFEHFIVVVHVGSTGSTTRNLIDWDLHGFHVIRHGRSHYAQWHTETVIQHCVVRQVGVGELIGAWVVLCELGILFKFLFEPDLLLAHFWLVRSELWHFAWFGDVCLWW